ncbi:MAG: type II toxin-antitoxin system YoeB family toxin, partial [Synergistaceae bacterium]|nr:type II toxin-antitoxin system YoeB family toxin [Synergistaceae bacterium]
IGKPERLKHRPGYYSRRIDKSNRLVYTVDKGDVYIVSCKGHYEEED